MKNTSCPEAIRLTPPLHKALLERGQATVGVSASRTFLSPFTKGTRVLALVIRFVYFYSLPWGRRQLKEK